MENNQTVDLTGSNRLQSGGNYGVETSIMVGEGIVSSDISVGAMSTNHAHGVGVGVAYDSDGDHVGVFAALEPSQARKLANSLVKLADIAEQQEEIE